MKILFATNNPSKAQRFSKELSKYSIEVLSLKDLNIELDVSEDGDTPISNALKKARGAYDKAKMITIGMDDSLYLEGIPNDEQPGLFVRRIDGKTLNDKEMLDYYINLVNKYGIDGKLDAKWIYGLALIKDNHEYTYTFSKGNFYLTNRKSDIVNPGYPLNTISINKTLNKYFTEMTANDWIKVDQSEEDVINFLVKYIKYN